MGDQGREYLGDESSRLAAELQEDHLKQVEEGEVELDQSDPLDLEAKRSLFTKISFRWRDSDRMILDQIRAASEHQISRQYEDVFAVLDNLYLEMRVPDCDNEGITRTDNHGRIIWKLDGEGKPIEDIGQMTGQDIAKSLIDLAAIKVVVSEQTNSLMGEALFAKMISKDKEDEVRGNIYSGTEGDKDAKQRRDSQVDRYHAFFRFLLWSNSKTLLQELNSLMKMLNGILDQRVWAQKG